MARIASGLFFRGRARLPELLDLPRQRARWRPLRYANSAVTQKLGWRPKIGLRAALVPHLNPSILQGGSDAPPSTRSAVRTSGGA
jgi:hypothetical protein